MIAIHPVVSMAGAVIQECPNMAPGEDANTAESMTSTRINGCPSLR